MWTEELGSRCWTSSGAGKYFPRQKPKAMEDLRKLRRCLTLERSFPRKHLRRTLVQNVVVEMVAVVVVVLVFVVLLQCQLPP